MHRERILISELDIPTSEIYRSMGFSDGVADRTTSQITERLLEEARIYLRPEFEYIIFEGSHNSEECQIQRHGAETLTFNIGRVIANQLRNSSRYALFVATVGAGYFRWMDAVESRQDMVERYISDTIGSQIVESVADFMESILQRELDSSSLKRTNRFSPGYCGWHLKEQTKLFSLFDNPTPCGIKLTDSCLMLPVKSVSGLIGIGEDVRYLPYTCHLCDMKMCYKKRRG